MTDQVNWVEPEQGFQYLTDTVVLTREEQARRLQACSLAPEVFGDVADPSNFIGMAIHAGIKSGISAEGNVNMLQKIIQHRPVLLDEPLTVVGEIRAVTAVPRGRVIDTDVRFLDEKGDTAITAIRRSLKPDPDKAGQRGAGERPAPVVEDPASLTTLSRHSLTPDAVKSYSMEGNSIHYEMEAANRAGFRAPLIGGGQGVHYLMAALWQHQQVKTLDMDIYFRRPIFWDDSFTVGASDDWSAMALVSVANPDKVLTEIQLHQLG